VSKDRYTSLKKGDIKNTTVNAKRSSKGMSYRTTPMEEARAFLTDYFSDDNGRCEKIPNPRGIHDIYHLPPWLGYREVWKEYVAIHGAAMKPLNPDWKPVSLSTFTRAWQKFFRNVKTPAVKRFSKCKHCTQWQAIISGIGGCSEAEKLQARCNRDLHWERVTKERRFLGDAFMHSIHNPDLLMVFEIDGMDSSKTLLPHMCMGDKSVNSELLIKYHLTCVKHVGVKPDEVYLYTDALPHDSSNTCTIIWMTLVKVTLFSVSRNIVPCSSLWPF
jgi:hypothetical protein